MTKKESKLVSSLQTVHISNIKEYYNFVEFLNENHFKPVIGKYIVPKNYTKPSKKNYQEFDKDGLMIFIKDKKMWYVHNKRSDLSVLSSVEFVKQYFI